MLRWGAACRRRPNAIGMSAARLFGRRVQVATPQGGEVREASVAADVVWMLSVPLGRVAQDHVVRVEGRAIVERDAPAEGAGPLGQVVVRSALLRQAWDRIRRTDLVRVERLLDLLA